MVGALSLSTLGGKVVILIRCDKIEATICYLSLAIIDLLSDLVETHTWRPFLMVRVKVRKAYSAKTTAFVKEIMPIFNEIKTSGSLSIENITEKLYQGGY